MIFYPFCLNTRPLKTSTSPDRSQPRTAQANWCKCSAEGSCWTAGPAHWSPQPHPRAPATPHVQGVTTFPLHNIRKMQTEELQSMCFCDSYDKASFSKTMCLPGEALKTRVRLCTDQEETIWEVATARSTLCHALSHLKKTAKAEEKCMEETVHTRTHFSHIVLAMVSHGIPGNKASSQHFGKEQS